MRNACFVFFFVFVFSFFGLEVRADSYSYESEPFTTDTSSRYISVPRFLDVSFPISEFSDLDTDKYYKVNYSGKLIVDRDVTYTLSNVSLSFVFNDQRVSFINSRSASGGTHYTKSFSGYFISNNLNELDNYFDLILTFTSSTSIPSYTLDYTLQLDILSIVEVSSSDASDYQSGYDAGFSEGYSQGESSGFSSGYSDGYSQGEESGYNSGYQAGVDSVDTQSYYDAGYATGEAAGYADGYDTGYDDGFNDALARYEGWGADNTNYPVYLNSYINSNIVSHFQPRSNVMAEYEDINYFINIYDNIDPTHTYKIEYYSTSPLISYDEASCGSYTVTLLNGGREYPFYCGGSSYLNSYYVKGSDFGDTIGLKVHATLMDEMEDQVYNDAFYRFIFQEVGFSIWDYGSSTGSQNETAKQTDDLIGGMQEQTEIVKGELENQTEQLEEQTETQKGILQKVSDFFGSFFENLKNAVVGLFVPSSDEMSELIDRMKEFFSDKFGFLYAPFDYLIQIVDVFLTTEGSTGLTFPGFSMMGYEVWPDMTYDLTSDETVSDIFGYVRIGTGVLLGGWFIMYLQDFFKQRFGGQG